jgi:RNA polymerase sigma factor (sigma-70 family)
MTERKSDHEIWESLKGGDKQALGDLYNRYFRALYNYGMKLIRDKPLVKDAIQDLFVELWKYHPRLGKVVSVKFYLYRSLRRRLIKAAESRQASLISDASREEHLFEFVSPHESFLITQQASQEQISELLKAMNSLTRRQKEAIYLKYYENLSYQEVASIMAITVKATYKVVLGAIDTLRKNVRKLYSVAILSALLPLQ